MANRNVSPDSAILKHLFREAQPTSISILLQNWDKCIFRADFPSGKESCVVRIEAEDREDISPDSFTTVSALQEIARSVIPELVPATFDVGQVYDSKGRKFQYSVVGLVEGETLEDTWEKIGEKDRRSIIADIVSAVSTLHSIKINDSLVKETFLKMLPQEHKDLTILQNPGTFGGPSTGFMTEGKELFAAVINWRKLKKVFCSIEPVNVGEPNTGELRPKTQVVSSYEDLGKILIDDSDIAKWSEDAVFCHIDLNPRNIMIRSRHDTTGVTRYKLSGIIDWEMAGFFPASYELSLQDIFLGTANRHIGFYLLLKEQMAELVPRDHSQVKLSEAMDFIWTSQHQCMLEGFNIPASIRQRFLEEGQLERASNSYLRFKRKEGSDIEIDQPSFQSMVDEVVEEMVKKRDAARRL